MDLVDVSAGADFAGIGTPSFIRTAFDNIRISDGKYMILVLQMSNMKCFRNVTILRQPGRINNNNHYNSMYFITSFTISIR